MYVFLLRNKKNLEIILLRELDGLAIKKCINLNL